MANRMSFPTAGRRWMWLVLLGIAVGAPVVTIGGIGGGFRAGAVGGISVDADGVVGNVTVETRDGWRQAMLKITRDAPADMNKPVDLRMVSLKGIEAAIADARDNNQMQLPDEVKYLAGLQRIQNVIVVPEENDILLVGPAEGWKVDGLGNVVGVTSGRPVMQLDDLVTIFRSLANARAEGISCSIDPTTEGRQSLEKYTKTLKTFSPNAVEGIRQALGPQQITLKGIPGDSHVARVLVAADYHMKRIAMNLDRSPVEGLPGYLDLIQQKRAKVTNMMPRWWLACNYEPLVRSEDSLTWEIRGSGVKALTEDDIIADDGTVTGSGKKSPVAEEWAKRMTAKYDALSEKNTIFGDLRNVMDLCVAVALIDKENLIAKANANFPLLTNGDSMLSPLKWPVPKQVSTQCSFIKLGNEFVITASGGVQVDSYGTVSRVMVNEEVKKVRERALARNGKVWWWN